VAIVAPAFPASGRTTRDGHQLLHGRRLETTEVWRHERMAGTAFLPGWPWHRLGWRQCGAEI
jgi:4-hydroxythreonine-4-phosphate dehydrogenase